MKILFTTIILTCSITCFAQFPGSWQPRGIGGGGALFSPSINPANTNEVYIACDMGELFHSTAAGQAWVEEGFMKVTGGHDSYVNFTNNPNIRYTIDYTSIDSVSYVRSMKSTNGGATWSTITNDPYGSNPNGGIERIFADYNTPNHVIVAATI